MKRIVSAFGISRLFGFSLLVALVLFRIADPIFVERIRLQAFDAYQRLHPRPAARYPVAIIDVDDRSLKEIGQWPWPRTVFADLTEKAMLGGAVAIAYDIIFAEPDRLSPDRIARDNDRLPQNIRDALAALPSNDEILSQMFARSRVVVGQTSVRSALGNSENKTEPRDVPHAFLGGNPTPYLIKFPDMVQNIDLLEQAASGFGVFTVRPDSDGVYRRVPVVMQVQGKIRLGLSIELLRIATGGDAFAVRSNAAGIDGVVVARQLVQTGPDGTVWNYFSPSLASRFISATDLLNDRVPPGRIAGQMLLVGTSAIGLEDFRATPLGVPMAGVEIHAQILENILGGTLLVRPNYAIAMELLFIVALSALIIGLAPFLAARFLILATVALVGGYGLFSYYLFVENRQLIDPTFPIFATVLSSMLMAGANYLREEMRKQQIRSAFGQYVSPDLVAELADNPQKLELGGEKRELSLLFTDVRGFTTISEQYRDDPGGLTTLMNQFLTVISKAIMDRNGTIDKFMGDAVMAFWNAPLNEPDHAKLSCHAGLEIMLAIEGLNRQRAAEAVEGSDEIIHQIKLGVGINTGTCIVGNMGSDMRFDYSALGDVVNLASRLEGQTKSYGVDIILGHATHESVREDFAAIELDLIKVKGKTIPEKIYALLGDSEMRSQPEFQRLAEANAGLISAYREQDWAATTDQIVEVEQLADALDVNLSVHLETYRSRVAAYRETPPPPDWDGAYEALSK